MSTDPTSSSVSVKEQITEKKTETEVSTSRIASLEEKEVSEAIEEVNLSSSSASTESQKEEAEEVSDAITAVSDWMSLICLATD